MNIKYDLVNNRNFKYWLYRCWIDEDKCELTVPLYSMDGRWVGVQKYNPLYPKKGKGKNRYMTHSSEQPFWGLETLPLEKCVVYVTEAVFRSSTLHSIGFNSISLMGTTLSKKCKNIMKEHPLYEFVWIGDPDKAGEKAMKYFNEGFISPKDIDEMEEKELIEFMSEVELLRKDK